MIGGIRAEMLVLRRRAATWVLLGIWIALAAFFAYILPYVTYRYSSDPSAETLVELLPANLVGNLSSGFPFFGGAIALMLGVLSIGSEYGWGTLKTLFTQGPGRVQVFVAKVVALGIVLIPFVAIVFALGAVFSLGIARWEHAPVDWPGPGLIIRALLGGWLILAVWTALGVMLGVLTRGTALAIGVGILYALVIEGLLSALARPIDALEPLVKVSLRANAYSLVSALGTSAQSLRDNGPGAFTGPFVSAAQAVLVLSLYAVALLVLSAVLLRRRDIA